MCIQKLLKYNIVRQSFTENGKVNMDVRCNGFTLKNNGNTLVQWESEYLQPGESISIGGNIGEVYSGIVDLFFRMPTPAPVTPVNNCLVTQKIYVDKDLKL